MTTHDIRATMIYILLSVANLMLPLFFIVASKTIIVFRLVTIRWGRMVKINCELLF